MGGNSPDLNTDIPREVVEDQVFAGQIAALKFSVRRLDEILFGVIWRIARSPQQCPIAIEGRHDLRITKTMSFGDIPAFRILFKFTERHVTLLTIAEYAEAA